MTVDGVCTRVGRGWLGLATSLLLGGCGGNSIADGDADGSGGTANEMTGSGGSDRAGGAGMSVVGGAGVGAGGSGAAGAPVCTPVSDPEPWNGEYCQKLARLAVTDPWLADASGDGRVSAGEHVVVGVTVRDVSGLGYNSYPGVVFEVDGPGVEFVTDPRAFYVYAFGACDFVGGEVELAIADREPPAVVRVVARAAALNRECPDAPALEVPISIE